MIGPACTTCAVEAFENRIIKVLAADTHAVIPACIDNPDRVLGAEMWMMSVVASPATVADVVAELEAAMVIVTTETVPFRIDVMVVPPPTATDVVKVPAVPLMAPVVETVDPTIAAPLIPAVVETVDADNVPVTLRFDRVVV